MKLSTTLALTVGAGVVAFLAGRLTQQTSIQKAAVPSGLQTKFSARATSSKATRETAESAIRSMGKYAACSQEFSAENAAKLSSDERLELLAMGASVGDFGNQAAMLCGIVSALTREELPIAKKIFETMESQGNSQAPDVWKSLWKQWGRLAPEECFSLFSKKPSDKSSADARNVMTGWLEMYPDAALAWAMEPGKSELEAAAAALAITRSVNGDLKQLESVIQKLPADCPTVGASLDDYFDLASLAGTDQNAAGIYENLPPVLRSAAWSVTAKRIRYENLETAKAWVTEHAADPGRNYRAIYEVFDALSDEDPAGTVKWAVQLPFTAETDGSHPATSPVWTWMDRDPDSFMSWLKTQQSNAPWRPDYGRQK